jgi:hypothetical protein
MWDSLFRKKSNFATGLQILFYLFGTWNPLGYWMWIRSFSHFGVARAVSKDTGLVVEGPGASASMAFVAYFKKWNPGVTLAHHTHCLWPIRFAQKNKIPYLVLCRNKEAGLNSQRSRFPYASRAWGLLWEVWGFWTRRWGVDPVWYEEVIQRPDHVIKSLNEKFGVSFNPGDGKLPHVRMVW